VPFGQDRDVHAALGGLAKGCLYGWVVVSRVGDDQDLLACLADEVNDRCCGESSGAWPGLGSGPDDIEVITLPGLLDGLTGASQEPGDERRAFRWQPGQKLVARVAQDGRTGLAAERLDSARAAGGCPGEPLNVAAGSC